MEDSMYGTALATATPLSDSMADTDLAARAASGDDGAFERIMRRHNRLLFRTARSILEGDTEAEDALQEAYLRAWRSLRGFRSEARLSTWLVRIVINESLGRLRRRGAQVLALDATIDLAGTSVEDAMEDNPDDRPDRAAMRSELRTMMEACIDALPETFRTVFMLRAVEELSVEEVSAALGLPEATVRTRFFPGPRAASRGPGARHRPRHGRRLLVRRVPLRPHRGGCDGQTAPRTGTPVTRRPSNGHLHPFGSPRCPSSRCLSPLAARRLFLGRTGLTLSGAAVALLAGNEALATKAGGAGAQDVQILNTALGAELEAIAAYQLGAESKLLQPGVLDLALSFQGHHKEHADLLAKTVAKLGGKAVLAKARYNFPVEQLKSQADVLKFAASLEQGAVSAYLGAVPLLATATWPRPPPASWGTRRCTGPFCARPWAKRRCRWPSCHEPPCAAVRCGDGMYCTQRSTARIGRARCEARRGDLRALPGLPCARL